MGRQQDSEAVAATFDEVSSAYAKGVNDAIAFSGLDVDKFAHVKARRLVSIARSRLGETTKLAVLDLGCGVGTFHRHLDGAFGELHGLDVSAASIELAARANTNCTYATYDGNVAPYVDGTFDLLFAACVIHHVPPGAWPHFVSEMRRLLKPGGLAVVFEHNPFNPVTRFIVSRCEFDEDAVLISPGKLRKLAKEAGFASVESRSIFTVPPFSTMCERADSHLEHLPFGAQYELIAQTAAK